LKGGGAFNRSGGKKKRSYTLLLQACFAGQERRKRGLGDETEDNIKRTPAFARKEEANWNAVPEKNEEERLRRRGRKIGTCWVKEKRGRERHTIKKCKVE